MANEPLGVEIYQIIGDDLMKGHRADGSGWEWCWADWQRDWMDRSASRFAYRCLPLTIANQTGLWVKNPVSFTAVWRGFGAPGSIEIQFDTAGDVWKNFITDQFGMGILTWNTPFLLRTQPAGSRILVGGPLNWFKPNAHPLTALIESDWLTASFTMNWKLMAPYVPVRFEVGEPLFQVIPLISNVCGDLEGADVRYAKLADNPELERLYNEWCVARNAFHEQRAKGLVPPDSWQKHYFLGRDMAGRPAAPAHATKIRPPQVRRDFGPQASER